jgi:hypothetical protein
MSYKIGAPVIITCDGVNRVGIVLDKFIINKSVMYDVLFENRTAMTMINTSKSKKTFINNELTAKLCETGTVIPTVNYAELSENDLLPIVRA